MAGFIETGPTTDAYWRSIILFGRNSASYKFALGKALLEVADQGKTFVSLEELAEPYARHLVEHLQRTDTQGIAKSSRFLDACRSYIRDEITREQLLERTTRLGFDAVIDAFHNVNQAEIPTRFFVDERGSRNGINITDNLLSLSESFQFDNLSHEAESRWRLVETAWSLGISSNLLIATYDPVAGDIYVEPPDTRRLDVTSCRDALNGYQKGKCFYCSTNITVVVGRVRSRGRVWSARLRPDR